MVMLPGAPVGYPVLQHFCFFHSCEILELFIPEAIQLGWLISGILIGFEAPPDFDLSGGGEQQGWEGSIE